MKRTHLGEIGYFLAGTAVGGTLAMLVTPLSGRRMRHAVKRSIEDGSDQIVEAADQLKTRCAELVEDGGRLARKVGKIA